MIKLLPAFLTVVALLCFAINCFNLHLNHLFTPNILKGPYEKVDSKQRILEDHNSNLNYVQVRVANSDDNIQMCLRPIVLQINAKLKAQTCDSQDKSQLFRIGESGLFHLFSDESLCLSPMRNRKILQLQRCQSGKDNEFVLQQSQGEEENIFNILWKQNTAFKISSDGRKVLLSQSDDKFFQNWMIIPVNRFKSETAYIPGMLAIRENNLILSKGLKSRIIAKSNKPVEFLNEERSMAKYHSKPDGAAVFGIDSGTNRGGWIYVSNSEVIDGGVGAITFNNNGDVIDYNMIFVGTTRNCGGGKTYWNTFVTCEENKPLGQVYEVNPFVDKHSQRNKPTVLGGSGGNYESFAFDNRDRLHPTFYVTNDESHGSLVRFTPDENIVAEAEKTGDYSRVLHTMGTLEYLQMNPIGGRKQDTKGIFSWTLSRNLADNNASKFYPFAEGIDVRDGFLYFTTKKSKSLFILDLDNLTYQRSSTVHGSFDGEPDQVARVDDLLYFCEEASPSNGIHVRDSDGKFNTILTSTLRSETSGIAFSPDNRHMYFSLQQQGFIYDITREDGFPFGPQDT